MEILHPFTVAPRAAEAIWGDGRLRDLLGRDLPADRLIGETWEVHDQDRVESGALAGSTLAEAAVRAFGGGLVLYEIQQCSTITYRLHDWGRLGIDGRPRELHVEQSLRVARLPQPPARRNEPLAAPDREGERRILAAGPHFALEAL